MNRIFHTRITWYQHLYFVLLGGLTFFLLWDKSIILAVVCMLLLVFLIERLIHTTYTLTTDGRLILSAGRFTKPKTVWLKDIVSVKQRCSVRVGRCAALHYVLIECASGRYISVLPVKEQEFIDLLEERRNDTRIADASSDAKK